MIDGASYCICKDGLSDSVLQKNIDYACGAGADCSAISQGGSCFNPNTVKDHCNYAVNSYFQKKGQAAGTCDFSGTATPTASPPGDFFKSCFWFGYVNLHFFFEIVSIRLLFLLILLYSSCYYWMCFSFKWQVCEFSLPYFVSYQDLVFSSLNLMC